MRVLFVLEYFPPHVGGVETLFDNLTKALASRGDDITILTSRVAGSQPYELSEGRKIRRISAPTRWAFTFSYPVVAKFAKEADMIHTTTYAGAIATKLAHTRKPTVATFHEILGKLLFSVENPFSAVLHCSLESLTCRAYRNDTLTCPSEATKRALVAKGVPEENIHVIPHGVDHKTFNSSVRPSIRFDGPAYLCMGRAGITKGIEYLIDAVPAIAGAVPNSRLILMLSKKDRYDKIIARAKKLGIMDKLTLLEPREKSSDVAGVIKSCDVVVVPSLSEGFGFNAVEAQACGVPVVSTTAGSLPEVNAGLRVPPKDSKALADAVIKLLKDKKLAKNLGVRGSRFIQAFTWEKAVREYIRLYYDAIS